tara:strand:- start:5942 stop:6685 length:744 start_codon:yes stop_codon:yes gene_type:complete
MSYLIIGSSSGLGRELAYTFAKNQNNLILVSRDERDLIPIKSDIEQKFDVKVKTIELDFSLTEDIEKKILLQKEVLLDLEGVMFPIGLMFEKDNLRLGNKDVTKILNANYLSIGYTIESLKQTYSNKDFLIVGFGSVSGLLGRNLNNYYAAAKRSLESHFESLNFDNLKNKLRIHFYTLGYLDTNLAFGKKLPLPKGNVVSLANTVYKNKNKKMIKKYFPFYWGIIALILKLTPLTIILKFKKLLEN